MVISESCPNPVDCLTKSFANTEYATGNVAAFDAHTVLQQLPESAEYLQHSLGYSTFGGCVIVRVSLQEGREILVTLDAREALSLAQQLIASASSQLVRPRS